MALRQTRRIPTRLRPGPRAWLGPAALVLGLASWLIPVVGTPLAGMAVVCAALSLGTDRQYRRDWMAITGGGFGLGQLLLALLTLLIAGTAP